MKWQPIETAPTDGTRILLRGRNGVYSDVVGQLVRLAGSTRKPAHLMTQARMHRHERILVALLDQNASKTKIAAKVGVAPTTAGDDCAILADDGYVKTWMQESQAGRQRWYALTPAGVQRAKALQEMEHGHH